MEKIVMPTGLVLTDVRLEPDPDFEPGPEGGPTQMPKFRCVGEYLGQPFERLVWLELDGRDMDEEHVSGRDLGSVELDPDDGIVPAVYESQAYQDVVKAWHAFHNYP